MPSVWDRGISGSHSLDQTTYFSLLPYYPPPNINNTNYVITKNRISPEYARVQPEKVLKYSMKTLRSPALRISDKVEEDTLKMQESSLSVILLGYS